MPKKRSSISALKGLLKVATDHGHESVAKGVRKMIARERRKEKPMPNVPKILVTPALLQEAYDCLPRLRQLASERAATNPHAGCFKSLIETFEQQFLAYDKNRSDANYAAVSATFQEMRSWFPGPANTKPSTASQAKCAKCKLRSWNRGGEVRLGRPPQTKVKKSSQRN